MCLLRPTGFSINNISNFGVGSISSIQICTTVLNRFFIIHEGEDIGGKVGIFEGMPKIQVYIITLSDAE